MRLYEFATGQASPVGSNRTKKRAIKRIEELSEEQLDEINWKKAIAGTALAAAALTGNAQELPNSNVVYNSDNGQYSIIIQNDVAVIVKWLRFPDGSKDFRVVKRDTNPEVIKSLRNAKSDFELSWADDGWQGQVKSKAKFKV